jgi:hypothetical protein
VPGIYYYTMRSYLFFLAAALMPAAAIAANEAYVCSVCLMGAGLVEQAAFQLQLSAALKSKCDNSDACNVAVNAFI